MRNRTAPLLVLLALLAAAPLARADLGRLFLTPEQRSALDARRKARLPDKPQAVVVQSPTTRIDGVVRRGDGRTTLWVNGEPIGDGAQQEGFRVLPRRAGPAGVTVQIGDGERAIDMKVGQSLDHATGEVTDRLQGGQAAPHVAPPRGR